MQIPYRSQKGARGFASLEVGGKHEEGQKLGVRSQGRKAEARGRGGESLALIFAGRCCRSDEAFDLQSQRACHQVKVRMNVTNSRARPESNSSDHNAGIGYRRSRPSQGGGEVVCRLPQGCVRLRLFQRVQPAFQTPEFSLTFRTTNELQCDDADGDHTIVGKQEIDAFFDRRTGGFLSAKIQAEVWTRKSLVLRFGNTITYR